jgi:hypothetical protein
MPHRDKKATLTFASFIFSRFLRGKLPTEDDDGKGHSAVVGHNADFGNQSPFSFKKRFDEQKKDPRKTNNNNNNNSDQKKKKHKQFTTASARGAEITPTTSHVRRQNLPSKTTLRHRPHCALENPRLSSGSLGRLERSIISTTSVGVKA